MSFIKVNQNSDFTIENLPYGIFSTADQTEPRPGVAYGDYILDLSKITQLLDGPLTSNGQADSYFRNQTTLNEFISQTPAHWAEVRTCLQRLLRSDALNESHFVAQCDAKMHLPVRIGDYTDFYSSIYHATNVGKMFRPDGEPLLPNWRHLPVGYHGRASSIVVSGNDVVRPNGQQEVPGNPTPSFGASKLLDFELEMAYIIGNGPTKLGVPVPVDSADEHIFGMVLMNDWSARDIQKWEYVPLGPFLSKSFATTISAWIVTMDALKPFRCPRVTAQEPEVLPYLKTKDDYALDIKLSVAIRTSGQQPGEETTVANTNFKTMYWSIQQQLAHHTVNGCNINPGDMMASGTVSGPTNDSLGCLLELSWKGTRPLTLNNGERRIFLQDGDEVIIRGHCFNANGTRIGFGECRGNVLPAVQL